MNKSPSDTLILKILMLLLVSLWLLVCCKKRLVLKFARLLPFLAVILATGCSTIIDAHKQKKSYLDIYYSGDIKTAARELTEESEDSAGTGDEVMWLLEAGTANYTAGEYHKSIEEFAKTESLIQDYQQRAVVNVRAAGAEVGSAITNPNALPYQGMYLDRVMLNAYKAMNYFAIDNPEGAQVELRRMREVQKQVVRQFADDIRASEKEIEAQNRQNRQKSRSLGNQNTHIPFSEIVKNPAVNEAYVTSASKVNKLYGSLANPFVSYLSAIGYLLENNYAEALVDFRNLYRMNPNNKLIQKDFVTAARRIGSKIPARLAKVQPHAYPLNKKIVYVLLFNGRAPALKQEKFQLLLPYVGYTGIAFPRYQYYPVSLPGLVVDYRYNNRQMSAQTGQVADFDAIMSQEYHDKLPAMITRLVVSTVAKEMASYAAVDAARRAGSDAEIGAYILTGIYKYMFNTADTRGWETLPKEVQITHVPIPDEGVLRIAPVGSASVRQLSMASDANDQDNAQIKHSGQVTEIKLKKETNIAIVYVRAVSANKLIYKLIELQ